LSYTSEGPHRTNLRNCGIADDVTMLTLTRRDEELV